MFRVDDVVRIVSNNYLFSFQHHYEIGTVGKISFIDPKDGGIKVISEELPYEQWVHESEIVHG